MHINTKMQMQKYIHNSTHAHKQMAYKTTRKDTPRTHARARTHTHTHTNTPKIRWGICTLLGFRFCAPC